MAEIASISHLLLTCYALAGRIKAEDEYGPADSSDDEDEDLADGEEEDDGDETETADGNDEDEHRQGDLQGHEHEVEPRLI